MRRRLFASLPALALVLAGSAAHGEEKPAERPGFVKLPDQIIVAKRMHPLAATEVSAVRVHVALAEKKADFVGRIETAVGKEPF